MIAPTEMDQLALAFGCYKADELDNGREWCAEHGGDWPLCKAHLVLPVVNAIVEEQARQQAAAELEAAASQGGHLIATDKPGAFRRVVSIGWLQGRAAEIRTERASGQCRCGHSRSLHSAGPCGISGCGCNWWGPA